MTNDSPKQVTETAGTNAAIIKDLLSQKSTDAPVETAQETPAAETPPVEATKEESLSRKAAQESKKLRAEREKARALQAELDQARSHKSSADELAKLKELSKGDKKALLEALGLDPMSTYQELTDQFLQRNLKAKDPVEEKMKSIDPYIEQLKKSQLELDKLKEETTIKSYIQEHVSPFLDQTPDDYEMLVWECGSKEEAAKQVYHAANHYWVTKLGADPTNIPSLKQVADHLEKQIRDREKAHSERLANTKTFNSLFRNASEGTSKEDSETRKVQTPLATPKAPGIHENQPKLTPSTWYDKRDESRMSLIQQILKETPRKK